MVLDRSDIITLVGHVREKDAKGVYRVTGAPVLRDVFCQVDSVTRAEFFAGGERGLKPEYRFTIFFDDYNGEEELIYNGVHYAIYRQYHARTDDLELYAEKKVGVHGT